MQVILSTSILALVLSTHPVAAQKVDLVSAPVLSPASESALADVMGDPHFITYDGTRYSYRGECDLVLAKNPTFDSGSGLDIHVRSEIVATRSLISNAVVRIGDDVFEVVNDETHYFNGVVNSAFPLYMAGKYEITKTEDNSRPTYTININNGETIDIFINKRMIGVRANKSLGSVGGMTGVVGVNGFIGRDGVSSLTDVNSMGAEWQVRDDEPMLFHSTRAPQYPQQCTLPPAVVNRRRLRSDVALMTMALSACDEVDARLKDFCIEDVLRTNDPLSANAYLDGVAF
jgi:von Willebrand factor type D domain